jgi:hypothetical protein
VSDFLSKNSRELLNPSEAVILACRETSGNELLARCVSLLQTLSEHKQAHARGMWEEQLLGLKTRPGLPAPDSLEIKILSELQVIRYYPTCQNPEIPEHAIRLLDIDEETAERIINDYCAQLPQAKVQLTHRPDRIGTPKIQIEVKNATDEKTPVSEEPFSGACCEVPGHLEARGMHMPPNHYCGYSKADKSGKIDILVISNDHKERCTLPELYAHFAAKTGPYALKNSK